MKRFIVISEDEKVLAAVPENFPEHYEIQHGVWALAATNKTAGDICKMLGIHPNGDSKGRDGVVVGTSAYNGYHNADLWEKVQLWEEL